MTDEKKTVEEAEYILGKADEYMAEAIRVLAKLDPQKGWLHTIRPIVEMRQLMEQFKNTLRQTKYKHFG